MPNWCHNYMKATGAADEIARFKALCIVDNDNPDYPGPCLLDFNALIPMPEALRGSKSSSSVTDGLLVLGRDDLVDERERRSLTKMLDWYEGVKTIEELKALLIERDPEIIAKAQQAIANHEQTGFLNWHDWSCANWGTKWNARDLYLGQDEANCLECSFSTAWSPPVPVWKKMGEMFPALDFELKGSEPMNDFAFRGTIRDGHLELHEEPVIWTTTDPKTGETVSGTREEIGHVLGERF